MGGQTRAGRVTGQVRDELARDLGTRYRAGASIRELAASSGRSYGFVHRLLSEAGVELRGRGGANGNRRATSDLRG